MKRPLFLITIAIAISATVFCQSADTTLIPYRLQNKWGFVNSARKLVVQPMYDEAGWFSAGYAVVKKGKMYGYINTAGKVVIPFKYTVAKPFRYGYVDDARKQNSDTILFAGASLRSDGYEICINTKGIVLAKCPAINENTDPEDDAAIVGKEKVYTLKSSSNLFDKIVDDYKVAGDGNSYFIAKKDSFYGVFNNKFEVTVPFVYSTITKFTTADNIYLQAEKAGNKTLFQGNGTVTIPAETNILQHVHPQHNQHLFIVSSNGKSGVKNVDNTWFIEPKYTDITYDENGGFVVTDDANNKGFYFIDKTIVAPKYSAIKLAAKGSRYLFVKTIDGKTGYVNANGDEFFAL